MLYTPWTAAVHVYACAGIQLCSVPVPQPVNLISPSMAFLNRFMRSHAHQSTIICMRAVDEEAVPLLDVRRGDLAKIRASGDAGHANGDPLWTTL